MSPGKSLNCDTMFGKTLFALWALFLKSRIHGAEHFQPTLKLGTEMGMSFKATQDKLLVLLFIASIHLLIINFMVETGNMYIFFMGLSWEWWQWRANTYLVFQNPHTCKFSEKNEHLSKFNRSGQYISVHLPNEGQMRT